MRNLNDISNFVFISDELKKSDIIFVPGNSSPQMAEKAAQLYKEDLAPLILPSGRYSNIKGYFDAPKSKSEIYNGTYNTEFEFLKDVLIKNDVPSSAILKEDRAQYTYQNALFSKEVTDKLGLKIKHCIICCKSYHARRCLMYYEKVYQDAEIMICPVDIDNITKENWYKTNKGIETVLGEFKRCGEQLEYVL
ncbi:MAG: YdcF family protein [Inconstantimicrobium porci]|uniref:YdcF family protein n=1 Tax=Inconstantimicrobium porci TaxID=2652291 RepID=UPI00240A43DD|nr:YdcF family protein [Inconstantimicrobium porci]MDD6771627.1 YdcF family protein [Inconstantimicrobium porci]MDY5913389.1 YdcF family protein [Inconstantimicrobium porci]